MTDTLLQEDITSFVNSIKSSIPNLESISKKTLFTIISKFKTLNIKSFKQLESKVNSELIKKAIRKAKSTTNNIMNYQSKDSKKTSLHIQKELVKYSKIFLSANNEPDLTKLIYSLIQLISYTILPLVVATYVINSSSAISMILNFIPCTLIILLGVIIVSNLVYQFSIFIKKNHSIKQTIIDIADHNFNWKEMIDTSHEEFYETFDKLVIAVIMFLGIALLFLFLNIPGISFVLSVAWILSMLAYIELLVLVSLRTLSLTK